MFSFMPKEIKKKTIRSKVIKTLSQSSNLTNLVNDNIKIDLWFNQANEYRLTKDVRHHSRDNFCLDLLVIFFYLTEYKV